MAGLAFGNGGGGLMGELVLAARIAGEQVALRAAEVESVIELDRIVPAPLVPGHIAGLAALRSRPMTVIDCSLSLGLEAQRPYAPAQRQAVVVEQDRHLYALLVDGVSDVVETAGEARPVPGTLAPGWARACGKLVETPAGALLLVDVAALIAGPEKAARLKEPVTPLRHA